MVISKLLVAASMALAVSAGPCRPSPSSISSSIIDTSFSPAISITESTASTDTEFDASTASGLHHQTTDTTAINLFTSTTFSSGVTATTSTALTQSQNSVTDTASGTVSGSAPGSTVGTASTTATTSTTFDSTAAGTSTTARTTTEASTTTVEATTTTSESITGSMTSSIEATTTTSMAPISTTFKLFLQGAPFDDGTVHYSGQLIQVRTLSAPAPFPAKWPEVVLSYDHDTQHLLLGSTPLCVRYGPSGYEAELILCRDEPPQDRYSYLTCDPLSDGGLTCNMPGRKYLNGGGLVNLEQTWNQFYLMEIDRAYGMYSILIGPTYQMNSDIQNQGYWPINIGTRAA